MRAPLRGLVLAGGFSRRFGTDKAMVPLQPEGRAAIDVMYRKLAAVCEGVSVSLRPGQTLPPIEATEVAVLRDSDASMGPFGGILAAFRADPSAAWLVVACDLFALDEGTLKRLIRARHPAAAIVAGRDPERRRPEPLCAIYEPACAVVLEAMWRARNYRLHDLFGRLPLAWISPARPDALHNFNHRATVPPGLVVGID